MRRAWLGMAGYRPCAPIWTPKNGRARFGALGRNTRRAQTLGRIHLMSLPHYFVRTRSLSDHAKYSRRWPRLSLQLTMRTAVLAVGELWHHRIRLAYSSRAMQPRRQRVHRSRRHSAFVQRCMNVQNHRDEARRALQSPRRAGAAKIQHPSSLATIPKIFLWFVRFLPISRDTHTRWRAMHRHTNENVQSVSSKPRQILCSC